LRQDSDPIEIVGAGPAGSAAALAALAEGRAVHICEKSAFPRHKVCGEFLSPGVAHVLEMLGVLDDFERLNPARLSRVRLHFGRREKQWTLQEPGFGLSRYALDALLLDAAVARGAVMESGMPAGRSAQIVAHGRKASAPKGRRLFGFKAHFTGPCDDAVELFFASRCYAGVSAVEGGRTNVCGLAPEDVLAAADFDIDRLLRSIGPLRNRIEPLQPATGWFVTGPLVLQMRFQAAAPGVYVAGDALGFVDPFTGSGILSALATGRLAGLAVARGLSADEHMRNCRRTLAVPSTMARFFRAALGSGLADFLAPLAPGSLLFQLTRPRIG
jgi:flavin-dependent dehydrogenase